MKPNIPARRVKAKTFSSIKTFMPIIVNEIKARISSVWKVEYKKGLIQLFVLDTAFTTEEVVKFVKVHHPFDLFTVSAIDVGVFNLRKVNPVENSYQPDGREMNQDGEIVFDFQKGGQ